MCILDLKNKNETTREQINIANSFVDGSMVGAGELVGDNQISSELRVIWTKG